MKWFSTKNRPIAQLNLFYHEIVALHNYVGEQFLTGTFHFVVGLVFVRRFQANGDVLADADVINTSDADIRKIFDDHFALRVQQFGFGHNVDVGEKFHETEDFGGEIKLMIR